MIFSLLKVGNWQPKTERLRDFCYFESRVGYLQVSFTVKISPIDNEDKYLNKAVAGHSTLNDCRSLQRTHWNPKKRFDRVHMNKRKEEKKSSRNITFLKLSRLFIDLLKSLQSARMDFQAGFRFIKLDFKREDWMSLIQNPNPPVKYS